MKTKFIYLFLFVFVISPPLCAQQNQKLDSLLNTYAQQKTDTLKVHTAYAIADFLNGHRPKLAQKYVLEGFELSQNLNNQAGIAKSHYYQGKHFRAIRKLDSAKTYFQKALQIYQDLENNHNEGMVLVEMAHISYLEVAYEKTLRFVDSTIQKYSKPIEDSIVVMNLLGRKAKVYTRQTKYEEGFKAAFKALAYAEALDSDIDKANMLMFTADLYHYTDNKPKAIALKKEALEIFKAQNNSAKIALTLNNLGNSHYVIKEYDIALGYLERSLPISRELELNGLIGITTFNVGKTYVRKGQIQKGIKYLKESIHYSQNISHNPLSESWALKRLADVYTEELQQPQRAIPILNRAISLADSVGNKDDLYQSYRDRSQAFAMLGDYKKAFDDHVSYKALNDTVYNIAKSKEIERLKTEFETDKKEQQLVFQEKEITVLEQEASISNLQRILLAICLLLSLIGFYAIRQKMKRNRLEKEKVDAELEFKKKELTTHALNLARKNETLENLKSKAQELKEKENMGAGYNQLIRSINFDLQDDNNWENFSRYFEEVHKDFNSNVKTKYPEVTSNELRLLALLKMNLSSKEIANILNISAEGIKKARYRLRKKLDLSTEDSLQDLVLTL